MKRNELIQKQIDSIMDTFDFRKVSDTMEALNWTWYMDGEDRVPEESEIRSHARNRMKELFHSAGSDSGGLSASLDEGTDEDGPWLRVNLRFILTDSMTDGESYED